MEQPEHCAIVSRRIDRRPGLYILLTYMRRCEYGTSRALCCLLLADV